MEESKATALIVRISGAVEESNVAAYKAEILAQIKAARKELKTDADFAEAEVAIKSCKDAEQAIAKAKADALNNTADVRQLFTDLDELSAELAKTRLALDKQVKTEKDRRKNDVIAKGCSVIAEAVARLKGDHPELADINLSPDESGVRSAVANKKTIDSMEKSVNEAANVEIARLTEVAAVACRNIARIQYCEDNGFPGLFPDKHILCKQGEDAVVAVIDARVAKFKLEKIEQDRRREEEEKAKLSSGETHVAGVSAAAPGSSIVKEGDEVLTVGEVKAISSTASETTRKPDFQFTVILRCEKEEAVAVAQKVAEIIGESKSVVSMKLTTIEAV